MVLAFAFVAYVFKEIGKSNLPALAKAAILVAFGLTFFINIPIEKTLDFPYLYFLINAF